MTTVDDLLAGFGLDGFRPGQREAVEAARSGRDALVVMPTGSGKSLCYQLPALGSDSLTVVVSPLLALMRDQVDALRARGVEGVHTINSSLGPGESRAALDAVAGGSCRLLYVAPERFANERFREAIARRPVGLLAVDEAHCVSEWGHDFRPDYRRLGEAREHLRAACTMALTATATRPVQDDIVDVLGLREPVRIVTGFDRPALSFDAIPVADAKARRARILSGLARADQRPAIVYAGTRARCDSLADLLAGAGLAASAYHAGLPAGVREERQARFMTGECEVLVATSAFGMGVDKRDVRSVWHWSMPDSLEAYYQEAGRAGRDGAPARVVLLVGAGDRGSMARRILVAADAVKDVNGLLDRLAREASTDGAFETSLRSEEERGALAVAERVGALVRERARGDLVAGRLLLRRIGAQRLHAVEAAARRLRRMRFTALDAMNSYATEPSCRRASLLRHFGDPAVGAPLGRCCDVCDPPPDDPAPPRATARAAPAAPDGPLAEALVAYRREQARVLGVPAYRVFANSTRDALVAIGPRTRDELARVPGVGPVTLELHGDELLRLIGSIEHA